MRTEIIVSQYVTRFFKEKRDLQARIHSVFPNGFNLNVFSVNELIYIGYDKENLSAIGLVIDEDVFRELKESLDVGQLLIIKEERMLLYTHSKVFTVHFSKKIFKDLTMIPLSLENVESSHFLNHIKDLQVLNQSGFNKNQDLNRLYQQLSKNDLSHFNEEVVEQLIGAGYGLTPSGDDFLQGAMTMEYAMNGTRNIQRLVEKTLEKRSTTDVSNAYYHAVFNFQGNATWVNLFQAIAKEDVEETKQSLLQIQRYGHTSGNDILLGMSYYLEKLK